MSLVKFSKMVIKSRRLRWTGNAVRKEIGKSAFKMEIGRASCRERV